MPAFIKTWEHPYAKSSRFYLLAAISAFLNLMVYNLEAVSIFQIYIFYVHLVWLDLFIGINCLNNLLNTLNNSSSVFKFTDLIIGSISSFDI